MKAGRRRKGEAGRGGGGEQEGSEAQERREGGKEAGKQGDRKAVWWMDGETSMVESHLLHRHSQSSG